MQIILAGSPKMVVDTFEQIIKFHNVVAIITQPDKKQGRGLQVKETAVANLARKYSIKVFKPFKIDHIYDHLKTIDFDLLLTFSYGQIFSLRILKLGKFQPLNIHASLLPKYRGAAPINHAILNGDQEIGITLIAMVEKMDAGDIYFQVKTSINETVDFDQATKIISKLATLNINKWLKKIENKTVIPYKQPNTFSYAPKITKNYGLIDHNFSIEKAKRRIKGLASSPGAFTFINGIRYKLFDYLDKYKNGCLELLLSDGKLFINDFQRESKKRYKIT